MHTRKKKLKWKKKREFKKKKEGGREGEGTKAWRKETSIFKSIQAFSDEFEFFSCRWQKCKKIILFCGKVLDVYPCTRMPLIGLLVPEVMVHIYY